MSRRGEWLRALKAYGNTPKGKRDMIDFIRAGWIILLTIAGGCVVLFLLRGGLSA